MITPTLYKLLFHSTTTTNQSKSYVQHACPPCCHCYPYTTDKRVRYLYRSSFFFLNHSLPVSEYLPTTGGNLEWPAYWPIISSLNKFDGCREERARWVMGFGEQIVNINITFNIRGRRRKWVRKKEEDKTSYLKEESIILQQPYIISQAYLCLMH